MVFIRLKQSVFTETLKEVDHNPNHRYPFLSFSSTKLDKKMSAQLNGRRQIKKSNNKMLNGNQQNQNRRRKKMEHFLQIDHIISL